MFMTKKRMTFLLQIFYQWRSLAKLQLIKQGGTRNNSTSNTQNSILQVQQPQTSNKASLQWFNSDHPGSSHQRNKLSDSNFFTFHRTAKQWHIMMNALGRVLLTKLHKE